MSSLVTPSVAYLLYLRASFQVTVVLPALQDQRVTRDSRDNSERREFPVSFMRFIMVMCGMMFMLLDLTFPMLAPSSGLSSEVECLCIKCQSS